MGLTRNNLLLRRCEFALDIFQAMYMSVCVDALSGLSSLYYASVFGGATLLLMIPYSIMAVKRFDQHNQQGTISKVTPGEVFMPVIDNSLLDFDQEGGSLVMRQPEGERTFLVIMPAQSAATFHFWSISERLRRLCS